MVSKTIKALCLYFVFKNTCHTDCNGDIFCACWCFVFTVAPPCRQGRVGLSWQDKISDIPAVPQQCHHARCHHAEAPLDGQSCCHWTWGAWPSMGTTQQLHSLGGTGLHRVGMSGKLCNCILTGKSAVSGPPHANWLLCY